MARARMSAAGPAALSDPQRRVRALAGVGFLGIAAAAVSWPRALSVPTSLAAGWLGASHLVAAVIRYHGCPELGAIATLLLGRRVETRCGPWELLDARLRLAESRSDGGGTSGVARAG